MLVNSEVVGLLPEGILNPIIFNNIFWTSCFIISEKALKGEDIYLFIYLFIYLLSS